ncbi:NADH dehydrogenase [ubiquinone] 1 beta subcomplex subunit [Sesamum angolense]|uniref:NADH dehydrogenase [ubiquinone] 1 beta subcomplex subunit 7 n=1 Tax=Sesamum angolense TaxID=2727404 RepID=A0AAE1T6P9_9LAMI|nr:NADH dehydrogenase [ubiquinone] 1 beta subcomplex subunit [Sesamum angolense]
MDVTPALLLLHSCFAATAAVFLLCCYYILALLLRFFCYFVAVVLLSDCFCSVSASLLYSLLILILCSCLLLLHLLCLLDAAGGVPISVSVLICLNSPVSTDDAAITCRSCSLQPASAAVAAAACFCCPLLLQKTTATVHCCCCSFNAAAAAVHASTLLPVSAVANSKNRGLFSRNEGDPTAVGKPYSRSDFKSRNEILQLWMTPVLCLTMKQDKKDSQQPYATFVLGQEAFDGGNARLGLAKLGCTYILGYAAVPGTSLENTFGLLTIRLSQALGLFLCWTSDHGPFYNTRPDYSTWANYRIMGLPTRVEFYLPWKCEAERHTYEKCEYELVMERMLQMQKIREREAQLKAPQSAQSIPLAPKTANA